MPAPALIILQIEQKQLSLFRCSQNSSVFGIKINSVPSFDNIVKF